MSLPPRPSSSPEYQGGDSFSPDPDDRPHIECRDLFKIYKRADLEVVALRGVDMEVRRGELVAIVGTSGSGKSTLLNILSGLDRPSAGQVQVGNVDLLNISDSDLVRYRRLDVGFVWQATGRNLVPYLSARDNIEMAMAIAGVETGRRRARSAELLEALGMGEKARRLPHQLSGGEQQRVSIGVAMANRPPLLLADEPTGELDTQTVSQCFEMMREMNRTYGVTVVVVTHYPGVAQYMDRVLRIRDGPHQLRKLLATHLPACRRHGPPGVPGGRPGGTSPASPGVPGEATPWGTGQGRVGRRRADHKAR